MTGCRALLGGMLALLGCGPELPDTVVGEGGRWERITPFSRGPRQEHSVVAHDGEVVVLGGFDDVTTTSSVERYDPPTRSWSEAAPLPVPLHHAQAAVVDGEEGSVIVVTGFLLGADFRQDGRVFVSDPSLSSWRTGAPMPADAARGAGAACALDGAVYVFGGLNRGSSSQVSRYVVDADAWEPLPDLPRALDHLICVAHDGALWIVAGRENGLRNHTGALLRFDPATLTFEEKSPMPTSRAGAAGAVVGDVLVVVGGEGNPDATSGVFADSEVYDFAVDEWRAVVPMRTPRHGMGAAVIDGVLYVPGGAPVQGFGATDVHERLVLD